MATKPHERAFALVGALLFLATAVATAVVVVWQAQQDKKNQQAIKDMQAQSQPATKEKALKGTKLANFTPTSDNPTSVQKTDIVEGKGAEVKPGDTITAHYTGAYAVNGEIFESSKDTGNPATFPLSGVIQGWQTGVPGMKVGGTRRLVIPGDQAYGAAPAGYVPGSTGRPMGTLVFDIELVKIGQ